jgi:hypothetical protein
VDRRAARAGGDAGLPQHGHRLALLQKGFQRAQLGVDLSERAELGEHELVVSLAEAVQVEDEPAEITISELARLAEEASAPPQPSARREAWPRRVGSVGPVARAGRFRRCGLGSRGG